MTGADGFIGSHLVEALVRSGASVRALVFYNSLNSWGWLDDAAAEVRGQFEVAAGDIRDPQFVRNTVRGCEIVLHLAALISIPFSYLSTAAFIDTNVTGTLNILQASRDCNVERVVCTSTSEVYGTARYVPIDEDHPLQAQSPYAASKIAADQLALSFHRSFGAPVVVLRPFNTYGPRQSARAVIATIIAQIANGAREIELGSLHPTRDFSFVADTVQGFSACRGRRARNRKDIQYWIWFRNIDRRYCPSDCRDHERRREGQSISDADASAGERGRAALLGYSSGWGRARLEAGVFRA